MLSFSVIFIHGLTGGMESTWTAKNAVSPWPQTLLPTKLPHARILTFGYDADVVNWRAMVSTNRIGNHAENLLTTVATHREEDNTVWSLAYLAEVRIIHLSRAVVRSFLSLIAWEAWSVKM